jgi:hypothetical protein
MAAEPLRSSERIMKPTLKPQWSEDQMKAGARMRDAWESFFASAGEKGSPAAGTPLAGDQAKVAAARARHEAALLALPNVVGVTEGTRMQGGRPTGEACIVVYVARKIARSKLKASEILPERIDDVPVDVVEVGDVVALDDLKR